MSEVWKTVHTLQDGDEVQTTLSLVVQITIQTPSGKIIRLPLRTIGSQERCTGARKHKIFCHLLRRYLVEEFASSIQKNIEAVLVEMEKAERTLEINGRQMEQHDG